MRHEHQAAEPHMPMCAHTHGHALAHTRHACMHAQTLPALTVQIPTQSSILSTLMRVYQVLGTMCAQEETQGPAFRSLFPKGG